MSPEFYFVFVLFVMVIVFSTYGPYQQSMGYEAHDPSSLYSKKRYYAEAYTNYTEQPAKLNPGTTDGTPTNVNEDSKGALNVFGFDGLYASPYGQENPIDALHNVVGSPECIGKSSGYFDDRGGLCLTPETVRLFQTRGGNQSGVPAQIGQ
jgi:hypothetical protein